MGKSRLLKVPYLGRGQYFKGDVCACAKVASPYCSVILGVKDLLNEY